MLIHDSKTSLDILTNEMRQHKKVFFTRFGDNDILQIYGRDVNGKLLKGRALGGNRTQWSEELQNELKRALMIKDDQFLMAISGAWKNEPGMKPGMFESFPYNKQLEKVVRRFTRKREFLLPVLFHYLYCFDRPRFNAFVDEFIAGKNVLFIGSNSFASVERLLKPKTMILVQTPETNAYDFIDQWWDDVANSLDVDLIIPCCGQASRVIQGRLWNIFDGHSIDMGSIFDAEDGKQTRTWIKMLK